MNDARDKNVIWQSRNETQETRKKNFAKTLLWIHDLNGICRGSVLDTLCRCNTYFRTYRLSLWCWQEILMDVAMIALIWPEYWTISHEICIHIVVPQCGHGVWCEVQLTGWVSEWASDKDTILAAGNQSVHIADDARQHQHAAHENGVVAVAEIIIIIIINVDDIRRWWQPSTCARRLHFQHFECRTHTHIHAHMRDG